MTEYVKVRSWHVQGTRDRTLCGRQVAAHPKPWQHQIQGWSAVLPMGDRSCGTCLRLLARREEAA